MPLGRRLIWDQHACLPLAPDAEVDVLTRFSTESTGAYVSVNVGYSPHSTQDVLGLLHAFRAGVEAHPGLVLAGTVDEIEQATRDGRIAVAFDLEDSGPLGGDLDLVATFAGLGLRTLLPSYNFANAAGCGCLDTDDTGLTGYGHDLVRSMNEAGMVVDGSHCSTRTGLDLCEASAKPVVYSHSCLRSVWDHPRNITDEQARACAATGGVIGITGVGIFLGPNTPTLDAMIAHLETAVDLVGVEHVGVSTDYSFDYADFLAEIAASPHLFDDSYTRWGPIEWMPPETFLRLGPALDARGWRHDDVAAVLGGNFARVAGETWLL